jgi:beta-glucosidase
MAWAWRNPRLPQNHSGGFGIVHAHYAIQQRTPKDSARWHGNAIATHGRNLVDPPPG